MAAAVLTGRGAGQLFFFVTNKVKVGGEFYRDYVLKNLVENYLPKIYGNELNKVWVHHDGPTLQTSVLARSCMDPVNHNVRIHLIQSQ